MLGQNRTERIGYHRHKKAHQVPEESGHISCRQVYRRQQRNIKGQLQCMPQVRQGSSKDYKGREDEGWEADVSVPRMWKKIRGRYRQAFIFFLVRHIRLGCI